MHVFDGTISFVFLFSFIYTHYGSFSLYPVQQKEAVVQTLLENSLVNYAALPQSQTFTANPP